VGVTAFASDADGSNDGVTYSLSENPNDAFAIDAETGEVSDFESAQSMQIEVTATSEAVRVPRQSFDIAVTDSNEFDVSAVSDGDAAANSVAENAEAGDRLCQRQRRLFERRHLLALREPERRLRCRDRRGHRRRCQRRLSNGVTYSLSENPNDAFAIDAETGEVTVADPDALDFESAQSMQIEVTATSEDGSSSTQSFDIAVTDSNEFDVSAVSDGDAAAELGGRERRSRRQRRRDRLCLGQRRLSENPNDAFAIDAETGEVTVADPSGLDFEVGPVDADRGHRDLRGRLELHAELRYRRHRQQRVRCFRGSGR
jgi:hypothetical protein